MRSAGGGAHGQRLRGLIAILWRAGLRDQAELALAEGNLDHRRGSLLIRRGKGGRRRDGPRTGPLIVIQRRLGQCNLGIPSVYLQGVDSGEIIEIVHARRAR